MYCKKCGKALDDAARFCSWCGSPVIALSEDDAQEKKDEYAAVEQAVNTGIQDVGEQTGEQTEAEAYSENSNGEDLCEPVAEEPIIEEPAFDGSKAKMHFSRIGWAFSTYALLITFSSIIILLAIKIFAADLLVSPDLSVLISIVSIYGVAFVVLFLMMRRIEKMPVGEKTRVGVGKWLVYLIIALGVMTMGSFVSTFVEGIIGIIVRGDASSEITTLFEESNPYIVGIYAVFIAPVGEEFIFRKLFIDRTRKYGGRVAVILSALAFALMHGNLGQAIPAFGAGLVLGYLYYSTGRLLPCILLHSAVNLYSAVSGLVAGDVLEKFAGEISLDAIIEAAPALLVMTLMALINISCVVLAIVLPIVLRRKIIFDAPRVAIPKGERFNTVILNVGMIAMLIVYVAQIILNYI